MKPINFNMLNFENKGRIFYFDQLRALAIIGVIVIHVAASYIRVSDISSFNWIIADIFNSLVRFAVPVFLMLSGALLLNKKYTISEFIRKRYPRILIPFIFWIIIYIVFAVLFQNKALYFTTLPTAFIFIGKMFLGFQGYLMHVWFVWMILSVYLFIPIINKWIQNSSIHEVEYFLIIWVITCLLVTFVIPDFSLNLTYFAGPIGFVILGYYLSNKKSHILDNIWIWISIFLITTITRAILTYFFSLDVGHSFKFETYSLLTVIQSFSIFLIFKDFNLKKSIKKFSSFLEKGIIGSLTVSLSKYSYGIYLVHILFLSIFRISNLNFVDKNALKWIPFLTILILILSWATLAIINRIPFLKKFSGAH